MAHESVKEIKCPYCDHEFYDSWEYNDIESGSQIECDECGKKFSLIVEFDVNYSCYRLKCEDGKHNFGVPERRDIIQETCNRWNKDKFLGRSDHKPHVMWVRECLDCEEREIERLPFGAGCPWSIGGNNEV